MAEHRQPVEQVLPAPPPVRGRAARADAAVYLVGTVAMAVLGMYVIRVAGQNLTEACLGLLLIGRRAATSGANLVQLGMSQALVRYIGMYRDTPGRAWMYAVVASAYGVGASAACLVAAHYFQAGLGAWLFPANPEISGLLAVCTAWLIVGTALGYIAHSTMLAERRLWWANAIRVTDSGFLLAALVWLGSRSDPARLLWYEGIGLVVVGIAILAVYLVARRPRTRELPASWQEVRHDCVVFGPPRGVATFIDTLTVLAGPWFLRAEPASAGCLALALTLVRVMQIALSPVSKVCSAVTAHLIGKQDEDAVAAGTRLLLGLSLYASVLATSVMVPWHRVLLDFWLGEPALVEGAAAHFSIVCWSIVPFLLFSGLKGIIEVRWAAPRNLQSVGLGLIVQIIAYYALRNVVGNSVAAGLSALLMFWTIGVVSIIWIRHYIGSWRYFGVCELLLTAGAIAGVALVAVRLAGPLPMAGAGVVIAGLIALLGCKGPSPFVKELRAFAMGRWRPGEV